MVKITGFKRSGEIVTSFTRLDKYNYKDVMRDIATIRKLEDTSMILGDDVPSLNIPFEEEGLACYRMIVEVSY